MNEVAIRAVSTLIDAGEALTLTPQIMAEFWNVATRPSENNGLGFALDKARAELTQIEGFFSMLDESAEVYSEWKRLVVSYGVAGVKAHDARLVAAMRVHGVRRILTFNTDDFIRYKEIETIHPKVLQDGPSNWRPASP
jgi:predicted nucleic acid-binding protein